MQSDPMAVLDVVKSSLRRSLMIPLVFSTGPRVGVQIHGFIQYTSDIGTHSVVNLSACHRDSDDLYPRV